jgi:hypothetical protein
MELYRVRGNSMYPVMRDNDLVVVKKTAPESLRKGNIIVFRGKNGQHTVHRLVKKGKGGIFYLKGDGYNLSPELINRDLIIGKAIGLVRENRYKPLNRGMELSSWFISATKGYAKRFLRHRSVISLIETRRISTQTDMTKTEKEKSLCRLIATQTLDKGDAALLIRYIKDGMDWSSVERIAFREGLSSLLYYHCRNLNLLSYIPVETRRRFGRIYAETYILNRHILKAMDDLADALKKRGLHVIVFKGASLLNTIYHDLALRPMEDIDLIVRQENKEELKGILESMGFVRGRFYTDIYYRGMISFDLHTDYLSSHRIAGRREILDIKIADVWRTAIPISEGAFLDRLSLYDSLIALSFHMLKHKYLGLIEFVDIAETIKKYQRALNWTELVEYSKMVRAERILLYAFLLMKRLVGFDVSDRVLIDLGKEGLSFTEKTLLRFRLMHEEPGALMNILWIFQIPRVGKKIQFVKELIFPGQEVMNQIFPASFPRVHILLRRAILVFSQLSSSGASLFRIAAKGDLPPL